MEENQENVADSGKTNAVPEELTIEQLLGSAVHKDWYLATKKVTPDNLAKVIEILGKKSHSYESICHACAVAAISGATAMDKTEHGGITGFQASAVMWEFIQHWMYPSNACGLRLLDMDKLLYPQYKDSFEKTISSKTWESVQNEAKRLLDEKDEYMHPAVQKHLRKIVKGKVPFGFKVKDEDSKKIGFFERIKNKLRRHKTK